MLCNHQVVAPGGGTIGGDYIAPLKTTHIDKDGSLRLILWSGNDALKGDKLHVPPATHTAADLDLTESESGLQTVGNLSSVSGFVSSGSILLPTGGSLALCDCNDSAQNSTVAVDGASLVAVSAILYFVYCCTSLISDHASRLVVDALSVVRCVVWFISSLVLSPAPADDIQRREVA